MAAAETKKIKPDVSPPYSSLLFVVASHKAIESSYVFTANYEFKADATAYMDGLNDIADNSFADALRNARVFSSVMTIQADNGEEEDFRGSQYKIWLSPKKDAIPGGWMIAKSGGGQGRFQVPTGADVSFSQLTILVGKVREAAASLGN
jgi:hypothetical protein